MEFSQATKVNIGSRPNHLEHNSLAKAFNSRILSKLGDCAWRIFYYAFSTFRGVRNPNGPNYAQEDEWFKFYGNIEPKMSYGKFSWPETLAGQPEGANVANPFMAWIFGNSGDVVDPAGVKNIKKNGIHGYWSEPLRLGGLEKSLSRFMPQKTYGDPNLNIVWYDSENQRGCLAYIKAFKFLTSGSQSKIMLKDLELLSLGVVGAARKHLRFVMESPILGRYAPSFVPDVNGKGGIFRKKNAEKDQIGQAMFYYLSYFRGTEDQRARHNLNGKDVATDGFDFETFFSKQFLLAPNYSVPVYEKDNSGKELTDSLGNRQVKYDSVGYPELYPQSLNFTWTYPLSIKESSNIIKTKKKEEDSDKTFSFKYSEDKFEFDTNPPDSNNKFCLSAILIQTSDLAVKLQEDSYALLEGFVIDMYVDDKLYETIPIVQDFKYITNRTAKQLNEALTGVGRQYYTYQFNKIHYFQYPVKGKISFKARATKNCNRVSSVENHGDVNLGLKVDVVEVSGGKIIIIDKFTILIKLAHVLEMKPSAADAYVMMRLATTNGAGENAGEMDAVGHFNANLAQEVFLNYIKYGVAYNLFNKTLWQNEMYVSANPVYESLRKFISSHIKMADRHSLVDYEVDQGDNSVLYFKRFSLGMKNTGIDSFRNLGPSITQVGNRNMIGSSTETFIPIIRGKEYIVLSSDKGHGFIHYRNSNTGKYSTYTHGSKFIGTSYYYVSYFSSPKIGVFELDGIVDESVFSEQYAPTIFVDDEKQKSSGTTTNEWCMFMSYNLYHPANSSYWKPDMYGDIMGALNSRCLTNSDALQNNNTTTSKNVKLHLANVSWRQHDKPLVVTAPPAYNFIEGANSQPPDGDLTSLIEFVDSCRMHQAPYKIRSVERVNPSDPKCEIIKVTLNGRLRSNYPDDWKVEPGEKVSEEKNVFRDRHYIRRSDENAVISYLLMQFLGQHCRREVIGDVALDNGGFWKGNRPWGCCHPRFYFTKLIPYVEPNTIMYSDLYRQMEYYLRAMCNGFINRNSELSIGEIKKIIDANDLGTKSVGGYDSVIGDYLFEDLMANSYDNSGEGKIAIQPNMTSGSGG